VDDEDASYTERFKNEAKIMAKLEHPAIVPVFDFGETSNGLLYFVMGFVDGTDIHQMIASQGRLPPEHALAITAHVSDALAYAHRHGVVHRDIKPSNVLINMEGQVKVADFGLAKAQDTSQSSGLTKTGLAMGTPDYVAPEALMLGVQTDGRADLYAVGVMLYQMLTGQIPRGAFDLPSKLTGCDPRFDQIVFKAMKYDREERYPTANDLRRDLDVILTAPLVQSGGQSSAAIPKAAMPRKPTGKPPQPQSDAGAPARTTNNGGAAATPNAAGKSARAPLPPAKSKAPLFIGLGAAAAIGIGAFVMFSSGSRETSSERPKPPAATLPSQGTLSSSATKSSPPPPKPAVASKPAAPQFPPGKWMKVFTKLEDLPPELRKPDSGVTIDNGWIRITETRRQGFRLPFTSSRNYGVRARVRREAMDDNGWTLITLRESGIGRYSFAFKPGGIQVSMDGGPSRQVQELFRQPYSAPVSSGQEYLVEVAVVGDRIVARYNDALVDMATDATQLTGTAAISGIEDLRDIEVINLDGLPEAEALKILGVDEKGNDLRNKSATVASTHAASEALPSGQWVKVFTKLEDLPEELRDPQSKRRAMWDDGWIQSASPGVQLNLAVPSTLDGNYGIRARFRRGGNNVHGILVRRQAGDKAGLYQLRLDNDVLTCSRREGSRYHVLSSGRNASHKEAKDEFSLEFAAIGSRFFGRLDSRLLCAGTDATHLKGAGGVYVGDMAVRDIEVINLDGLPEAEALKILGVDEKGNDLRQKPAAVASATPATSSLSPSVSKSSSPSFAPGQWVKVFTKVEDLPEGMRGLQSGGMADGWIKARNANDNLMLPQSLQGNYAMRMTIRLNASGENNSKFAIRLNDGSYNHSFLSNTRKLSLQKLQNGKYVTYPGLPTIGTKPFVPGEMVPLEFGVVGARLVARVDSRAFYTAVDPNMNNGVGRITINDDLRDIEVINLDGLPEAEALRILGVDEKGNDLRALAAKQEQQKAEMAKQADAMAAIPELKALHEQFVKLQAERVTAPFEAEVAALNTSYLGGLDRKMTELQQKGDLDGVLALEAEKRLIADKQPMPAEDNDTTPATLKDLRKIYRDAFAKLEATRVANLTALTNPLDTRLKQLESTLTQANRIDHAKTVREYRAGLGKEGSAGTPARSIAATNQAAGTGGSPANEGEKLSDKEVVEWALSHQGYVTVFKSGEYLTIQSANQIPKGSFEVTELDFAKAPEPRSQITDAELEKLAGLKELRQLQLQWRKGFEGSFLAKLTGLRKLTYVTLSDTSFQAAHLPLLSLLPSLETLRCDASLINEAGDKLPKRLKTLAVHGSPSLELLTALRGYRELSGLKAINFPLTVAQAQIIAQLQGLANLEIGFSEDPAILSELSQLPRLSMLIFSSTNFAIPTLAGLKQLPDLRHLRLNAEIVQKDPAGFISILAELKKLERVELTTTPAFAAQARTLQETLQKSLPKIKVSVL
jgi:serine/threonine protein kinase